MKVGDKVEFTSSILGRHYTGEVVSKLKVEGKQVAMGILWNDVNPMTGERLIDMLHTASWNDFKVSSWLKSLVIK